MDYTVFDFSRFHLLQELVIGNDCFSAVDRFVLDKMYYLKVLRVGNNSFTKAKSDYYGYDFKRSFHILNCLELESIDIGTWSFSDYAGGFELRNLPKLCSIKIGEVDIQSYNFCFSPFVVKGILPCCIVMSRSS